MDQKRGYRMLRNVHLKCLSHAVIFLPALAMLRTSQEDFYDLRRAALIQQCPIKCVCCAALLELHRLKRSSGQAIDLFLGQAINLYQSQQKGTLICITAGSMQSLSRAVLNLNLALTVALHSVFGRWFSLLFLDVRCCHLQPRSMHKHCWQNCHNLSLMDMSVSQESEE